MPEEQAPPPQERKDAVLAALRTSEKKYRTIFENACIPTIIIEKNTKISLANDRFRQLVGFNKKEIEGKKKWTEFVAPDMVDPFTQLLAECRVGADRTPRQFVLSLVDRNNQNGMYLFMWLQFRGRNGSWYPLSKLAVNSRQMNTDMKPCKCPGLSTIFLSRLL
jgi:PAS domain S-box-containing protein